jgi:hypothetical protein
MLLVVDHAKLLKVKKNFNGFQELNPFWITRIGLAITAQYVLGHYCHMHQSVYPLVQCFLLIFSVFFLNAAILSELSKNCIKAFT